MLKAAVRNALRFIGLEIQKAENARTEHAVLRRALRAVAPDVVLDVGANTGQFGISARETGYSGHIVSFEALPDVHAKLVERASRDHKWRIAECAALGSAAGTAEINVAGNIASSSLLPMLPAHVQASPQSTYIHKIRIPVVRLDAISKELVSPTDKLYLKIDTQGFEREVLRGATGIMNRVAALQLELSLVPLYETAPSFIEMLNYIHELGFEFFDICPGFSDPRNGRLLQLDGLFVQPHLVRLV